MAKITDIIFSSNTELIRSQIAALLALELSDQKLMAQTRLDEENAKPEEERDQMLISQLELNIMSIPNKVFENRIKKILPEEFPLVNVQLSKAKFDILDTNTKQVAEVTYDIEIYQNSEETAKYSSDYYSTAKVHRLLNMCRAIISDRNYVDLGFDPFTGPALVSNRYCQEYRLGIPDHGADDARSTMVGIMPLVVKTAEDHADYDGIPLLESNTVVLIKDSNKGYAWKHVRDLDPNELIVIGGEYMKLNDDYLTIS